MSGNFKDYYIFLKFQDLQVFPDMDMVTDVVTKVVKLLEFSQR